MKLCDDRELVKADVLVNGDRVDALSVIVHRTHAEQRGRRLLVRLKEEISRHLFEIPLQCAIGCGRPGTANNETPAFE